MNAFIEWLVMHPEAYVAFWCVAIPAFTYLVWALLGGER